MFPGFPERLKQEMTSLLAPRRRRVNIVAQECRKNAVWIGGSILASLSCYNGMLITRQEYNETGAAFVHKKHF